MLSLYELTGEYLELLNMAEADDIDPETLADTLEAVGGEIEIKADGYAKVIAQLEYDVAALKAEKKRLQNRQITIEANIARMKHALQGAMEATGKTKFKTELFSFNVQLNPPAVVVDEQHIENMPVRFLKQADPTIDRTALREALMNGEDLEGIAHLERSRGLRIK